MNHFDLFSGIGGFTLAASWAGINTIGFSEINPYASAVLKKHFPNIPNLGDIKQLTSLPIYDIIKVCHALKTLSTTTQPSSILKDCQSRLLPNSTESLDKQCIKYSLGEVLSSVLSSKEAQTIASTEVELGRTIMPTTLLNTLSERVLSNAEQLVMGAEHLRGLRMAEQEYKRTTPTITSLLKLCGSARNAITNGTNTTPLLPVYEFSTEDADTQRIDLLTAGVPCQPSSFAGKRRGQKDDRWLWPQTLEVVRVFKPRWVILENVGGFITIDDGMALEGACAFLEAEGYEVQPLIIPACAVGAPHRRDRVWIISYSEHNGRDAAEISKGFGTGNDDLATRTACSGEPSGFCRATILPNGGGERMERNSSEPVCRIKRISWREDGRRVETNGERPYLSKPLICRGNDGVPNRVDRIKCCGNAIVPQVAYEILSGIVEVDK